MAPRHVLSAGSAAVVLASTALMARSRPVSHAETTVFRTVNEAPGWLHIAAWPVMQMGSLGAVFATAAAAYRRRPDPRRTVIVAAAGTAVWGGIKLIKPLAGRGRPADLLPDVNVRGPAQTGLGYPSGHAAVSVALALLASSSPRERAVALSAAALTGLSRIYVGAHMPLDVVGGFAAGWLAGLVGSAPVSRRTG
jgi:undecaprenyl-diphosphatase